MIDLGLKLDMRVTNREDDDECEHWVDEIPDGGGEEGAKIQDSPRIGPSDDGVEKDSDTQHGCFLSAIRQERLLTICAYSNIKYPICQ